MRHRSRTAFAFAMTISIALAGCDGGESTGPVAADPGKDPKLMDAMGGYMNKRKGAGKTSAKAKPAAEPTTPEEPKPAP